MPKTPHIAIVSIDAKLAGEVRGATRYTYLASLLCAAGMEVDFITASFQHWEKRQRDLTSFDPQGHPFRVRFIPEPSYPKNLCPQRIAAHRVLAHRIAAYFRAHHNYDLIYCQIPPNDIALAVSNAAQRYHIPFVVDVNDLWPEAFRIAFDVPVVSDLLFASFYRQARQVYDLADAVVGTSEEYAHRAFKDRDRSIPSRVVYVGIDLQEFDAGVAAFAPQLVKPAGEVWVSYAGTLSACYDLHTLVRASACAAQRVAGLRIKILGDGAERSALEELACELKAPVEFCGYMPYQKMAGYLSASDIVVNSLVANAPQSVPTKIGDYLAAGKPMISTSMSPEFWAKVERDGFGVNVRPGRVEELADVLVRLAQDPSLRSRMGQIARATAEAEFDRPHSYKAIVELIEQLIG